MFLRRGTPESFGWLRLPVSDQPGRSAWETPAGAVVLLPVGTRRLVKMLPSLEPVADTTVALR